MALLLLFVLLSTPAALAQFSIQGCPMWGCSSQGTFSILMDNPPMENVSVLWKRDSSGEGGVLPPPQGCASDGDNAVCLVPGTTSNEVGLEASTGDLVFTDKELRDPTVPVIALGGLTFSMDKGHLQCRLPNGTMCGTSIPLKDFPGVYNLVVSDDGFLLITVPVWGLLVIYLTAGIPHASIYLDQTVAGVNGTFLPVAQPVIDGQRAYFLTKFGPSHWEKPSPKPYPLEYRVYRVDLTTQMAPRMVIRWYYPLVPNSQGRLVPKEPVIVDSSNYSDDVGSDDNSTKEQLKRRKWEWAPSLGNDEHRKVFGSGCVRSRKGKSSSQPKTVDDQNMVDTFWNDIKQLLDGSKDGDSKSNQKVDKQGSKDAFGCCDKQSQEPPKNDPFNIYHNLLLADNGRIYVSFVAKDKGNEQDILPQLFLFEESPKEGDPPKVLKTISDSVASLAMRQEISFQSTAECTKGVTQQKTSTKDKLSGPLFDPEDKRYLWSLMGHDVLVALDPGDLFYARMGNLSGIIGTKLNVTSKIMVFWSGGSTSKAKELLVFGVTFESPPVWKNMKPGQNHSSEDKKLQSDSLNYVVAVDQYLNLVWKLAVPDDSPVVGQMAGYSGPSDNGVIIATTAKGTVFAIKG